jgi:hypothetical protein
MVVANNEIDETKNAGKSTTILMGMPPGRYRAMRIAQWSTSRALTGIQLWTHMRPP